MPSPPTVEWTSRGVRLIDQTLLPRRTRVILIRDEKAMWEAIKSLRVRGAPAIGVAAAYGLVLAVRNAKPRTLAAARKAAEKAARYLGTSRPTAVNLFWALEECRRALDPLPAITTGPDAVEALLERAHAICADDQARCAAMARHGAPLLKGLTGVLTHCNAGALATAGAGTAVGVIIEAASRAKGRMTVYVDETRPLLQGARLTAWELKMAGVPHRLICDSMAAITMQRGLVQAAVTGADRIASNGDSANKIGTLQVAIVARHFRVPFYIAAPLSTVDMSLKNGAEIPIEERGADEVRAFASVPTAPPGTQVFNPAFDVVPARLIAGIITEAGVIRPPFGKGLRRAFG